MVTDNITVLVNDPFISLQAGPCNTSNNLWIQFTHLFDPKKTNIIFQAACSDLSVGLIVLPGLLITANYRECSM